ARTLLRDMQANLTTALNSVNALGNQATASNIATIAGALNTLLTTVSGNVHTLATSSADSVAGLAAQVPGVVQGTAGAANTLLTGLNNEVTTLSNALGDVISALPGNNLASQLLKGALTNLQGTLGIVSAELQALLGNLPILNPPTLNHLLHDLDHLLADVLRD